MNLSEPQPTNRCRPGSPYAVEHGCTCPVLTNGHGRGYYEVEGKTMFVMMLDCPIHGRDGFQDGTETESPQHD